MTNQDFIVMYPDEYLNSEEDSTVFGEIDDFGKLGGKKIDITQKSEDGDGSLAIFPEHWGSCFGIQEVKPFEEAGNKKEKKEEDEEEKKKNKDEPPKFDITYVLDSSANYDKDKGKMSDGAQKFYDSIALFRKRLLTHLKQDEVLEELPDDIQMKLRNPDTEDAAIRSIIVYPNKTETTTSKNGKTKEKKIPDTTKPPRMYGVRVLRSKKGSWLTEFHKAKNKEPDADMEENVDPNSLMGVNCEIRPVIKLDYLFVKENKLCLQCRLLEAIVIPYGARKLGGLVSKKLGRSLHQNDDEDPNTMTEGGDGDGEPDQKNSDAEEEERKRKRAEKRKNRKKTEEVEGDD